MANLDDLAVIAGHKSISDMTDEELLEHLRRTRLSRRQTKHADLKLSEAALPKRKVKKQTTPAAPSVDASLASLSAEQLEALLKQLGGDKNE